MSEQDTVLALVQQTLVETFKLDLADVTPEKELFKDLDLDSLDAIDMAAELGTRSNIRFSNDDLRQIRTVDDIVQAILAKQRENA